MIKKHTIKKPAVRAAIFVIAIITLCSCANSVPATVKTADDIFDKTIGALSGASASAYAERYGTAQLYESAEAMMGDLSAGVIDCVLTDNAVASRLLRLGRRVTALSEPLVTLDYRIAAALESRDMMLDIDAALASLRDAGTLRALEERYILGQKTSLPPAPDLSGYTATLRLAVPRGGFPPYSGFDEDGGAYGFDIDLARYICGIIGVGLEIVEVESHRIVDTVRFGRADFSMGGIFITEELSELAAFSESYTTVEIAVLTRR